MRERFVELIVQLTFCTDHNTETVVDTIYQAYETLA